MDKSNQISFIELFTISSALSRKRIGALGSNQRRIYLARGPGHLRRGARAPSLAEANNSFVGQTKLLKKLQKYCIKI